MFSINIMFVKDKIINLRISFILALKETPYKFVRLIWQGIVLFKSLRNSKRRNKGNFTSKSNSNKIKLCGVGGNVIISFFRYLYNF